MSAPDIIRPRRTTAVLRPVRAAAVLAVTLAVASTLLLQRALDGLGDTLVERPARNRAELQARGIALDGREDGNVITDNLGMIVFGIVTIVVLGAAISGLGGKVITWVTKQLGV